MKTNTNNIAVRDYSETNDIGIFYYPDAAKGSIAVIKFYGGMESLIDSERVKLVFDSDSIYFYKGITEGLRLSKDKIQLWSLADHCKHWEGMYPLKFDVKEGCYKICRSDRREYDRDRLPSRKGESHNYTPHYGEISKRDQKNKKEDVVENLEVISNVNYEENLSASEKTFLSVLLNKSINLIDEKEYDKVKAVMITMKSLIES